VQSAIYEGTIRHRRVAEREHEFRYGVAMAYLDLDELDGGQIAGLTSSRRGLVRFRRGDYFGDAGRPLADSIRDLVALQLGAAPGGPIRLLTHLRSFGHCFNPVSFYYCFAPGGERLEAIVAEVTNTPWGERHAYVLPRGGGDGAVLGGSFGKELHVSPFMGMDQRYWWRAPAPGEMLSLHVESREAGARAFDATLKLARRPLDRRTLVRTTLRYPAATQRMLVLIYAHAVALWLKGVRIKPHPGARTA
jgi:DUF1365 family protein